MKTYDKFYINGEWVSPAGNETLNVINPATEEVCGVVPMGAAADIDAAVAAAKEAFPSWSALSAEDRAEYLDKIGKIMQTRMGEFANTICEEMGMPLPMATAIQVGMPMANFGNYARIARTYEFDRAQGTTQIVR